MEAYNKLLALQLTSDAPGVATCHIERFWDLEGQVNLDDNELVIDLFRGSLTWSLQEKFEQNPPMKRWEWYREVKEIDWQRMLLQQSSAWHPSATPPQPNPGARPMPPAQGSYPTRQLAQTIPTRPPAQTLSGNLNQPTNHLPPHQLVQGPKQGNPALSSSTCHVCKGPKVMITAEDLFGEGATDSGDGQMGSPKTGEPKDLDFSPYQPPMDTDHEEAKDDVNEGNDSGAMH
ncbi:hypothetical protein NDA14_006583 [Ustilago hordei]|nr:hypothetical protein NDA14_006583 [Ustilago hordei]